MRAPQNLLVRYQVGHQAAVSEPLNDPTEASLYDPALAVRVRTSSALVEVVLVDRTDGQPVGAADLAVQIDTRSGNKAARSDVAVPTFWRMAMVEPEAAVMIGGSLGSTNSGGIAVCARQKAHLVNVDRVHKYKHSSG